MKVWLSMFYTLFPWCTHCITDPAKTQGNFPFLHYRKNPSRSFSLSRSSRLVAIVTNTTQFKGKNAEHSHSRMYQAMWKLFLAWSTLKTQKKKSEMLCQIICWHSGDSITTLVTVFAVHLCSLTQESMKTWALSNNKSYTLKMRKNTVQSHWKVQE